MAAEIRSRFAGSVHALSTSPTGESKPEPNRRIDDASSVKKSTCMSPLPASSPAQLRIFALASRSCRLLISVTHGGRRLHGTALLCLNAPPCVCVRVDFKSSRRLKRRYWMRDGDFPMRDGRWRRSRIHRLCARRRKFTRRCGSAMDSPNLSRRPSAKAIPEPLATVAGVRAKAETYPPDVVARSLVRRTTLTREWRMFLAKNPVLLLPVSAELPFPDGLDLRGDAGFQRVWEAQLVMRALAAMGLPGLTVSTSLIGSVPVGVQVVAGHYREDLCFRAAKAIEDRGTPPSPIDPKA